MAQNYRCRTWFSKMTQSSTPGQSSAHVGGGGGTCQQTRQHQPLSLCQTGCRNVCHSSHRREHMTRHVFGAFDAFAKPSSRRSARTQRTAVQQSATLHAGCAGSVPEQGLCGSFWGATTCHVVCEPFNHVCPEPDLIKKTVFSNENIGLKTKDRDKC